MNTLSIPNFINGSYVAPASDAWIEVVDPSRGTPFGRVADSSVQDVELAVAAARDQHRWREMSGEERATILYRIADGIDSRRDELALLESRDNGKPVSLALEIDIPRAARNFRFFASAAVQFSSESHHTKDVLNYTVRQPLGVVACISPWNLPLYLLTWKVAPALATGNTVVAKPSEITPATAGILGEICNEAGLPAGALNIVNGYGDPVGTAICQHPLVKAVSFTGSTRTGRLIAATAAPLFKKLSLEMGGKNPVLVFADCDFEKAVETTVRSSFTNQGEICLCGSRILVEEPLYERFRDALVERTRLLRVGDPRSPQSDLGAIVSAEHLQKIESYISLARDEGGTVLTGGSAPALPDAMSNGWYFEPTIIEGLANGCRTNQEEIFGPVVTVAPFADESEALDLANDSEYGLASVLWTSNLDRAHRLSAAISTGIVWVNCWMKRDLRTPFGGMQNSGVGREGGLEVMRFFTEPRNITIDYS